MHEMYVKFHYYGAELHVDMLLLCLLIFFIVRHSGNILVLKQNLMHHTFALANHYSIM